VNYEFIKLTAGVICTIGLYCVLYKENKFYRFFEHLFLGLASGWMLVALWTETLKENWWDKMCGRVPEGAADPGAPGFYLWALMIPIGAMGYFVFSKKHAWIARIPIGIIIGLWSGQQFNAWIGRYWPQIQAASQPIFPTTNEFTRPVLEGLSPAEQAEIASKIYGSQALVNLIALITFLSVLSYFLFSFNFKGKAIGGFTKLGRYLLMVGFGAIFGSTVMMRFSLLIDRMYFIWIEWLKEGVLHIR
jgi:hypothetical protein